jgi:ribonuclease HI
MRLVKAPSLDVLHWSGGARAMIDCELVCPQPPPGIKPSGMLRATLQRATLRQIEAELKDQAKADKTERCKVMEAAYINALPPDTCIGGTDGSWDQEDKAGYGITLQVLVEGAYPDGERHTLGELWGPVELDPDNPYFVGCVVADNNSGELTAMVMLLLLLVLQHRLPLIVIWYDSAEAARWLQGTKEYPQYSAVVTFGRELLRLVRLKGTEVRFGKVAAHTGDPMNEAADKLAKTGMKNEVAPYQLMVQPTLQRVLGEMLLAGQLD